MFKYFTPQEATKTIPDLKRRFETIIYQQKKIITLQEELERIFQRGMSFDHFMGKKQELNSAISRLYILIEELEGLGIIVKSIEEGLVDFPSIRFQEEVWLCWKIEETEVSFWHGKNEGYRNRKTLAPKGFVAENDLADLR